MPVSGPERCPQCNYDLRGLPVPHRCPECGLAYDEYTRIWRPAGPWRIVVLVVPILAMILANLSNFVLHANRPAGSARWLIGASVMLMAGISTLLLYRIFRANRSGRCLAVLPDGIRLRTHGFDGLIRWTGFERVETDAWHRLVLVSDSAPPRKLDLRYLIADSETSGVVDEIRRAQARYLASAARDR